MPATLRFGFVVLLSVATSAVSSAADRPNFILCMADDQGWGDVGYYGNPLPKTPTLDEMSRTGLRFDQFYAASPVCSPTRGSVLTGRYPNRFGCFRWGYTLRPQEITIAEALKTAGYTTGHFGKWHLGSVRAESPVCPGNSGFDRWFSSPNFFENDPLMSDNGKAVQAKGESSRVTADAALKFIRDAAGRKKPFLAVVWFGSPHAPHIAAEEFRKLYKDQPAKVQQYYGEITGIDHAMGHLRQELRKLGIAGNTLLWYTSDNGSRKPGSAGGLRGQKGQVWEGGIRVPTIIEWPARIKSPAVTKVTSGTVDIYPTLLDIAGVTMRNQPVLDGVSLVPLVDGKMTARAKPLGFWYYPANGRPMRSTQLLKALMDEQAKGAKPTTVPDADAGKIAKKYSATNPPGHAAWIDGDYKLHRIPGKGDKVTYSLYNLAKDAQEKSDLAAAEPKRLERMKEGLAAWQKSVAKSLNGEDYTSR